MTGLFRHVIVAFKHADKEQQEAVGMLMCNSCSHAVGCYRCIAVFHIAWLCSGDEADMSL